MTNSTFSYETTIIATHIDSYGHVNNATYLQLFEEARYDLATTNGFGHKKIMAEQKGPIVLEARLKYKRELRVHDEIKIESIIEPFRSKVTTVYQNMILTASGEVSCAAEFKWAFFDLGRRKLIVPTPEWLTAIGF